MFGWLSLAKNLRLALEPRQPIRISRERLGQDLQRHLPVQLRLGGLVALAHAALADQGGDVVVPEAGAGLEWHSSHQTSVRSAGSASCESLQFAD